MSKKMTPCEKLGYKVGDEFEVIEDSVYFKKGDIVSLKIADDSIHPFFINEKVVRDGYSAGCAMYLSSVKKISKLKPAKQALADAIHQNGGWVEVATFAVSGYGCVGTTDTEFVISFFNGKSKPSRYGENYWSVGGGDSDYCGDVRSISITCLPQNWHQCILSRDEYFTAYPEQVKVEVNNETERRVGVEMKSESEATINASDWHKNGELPPVGEVCEFVRAGDVHWHKELNTGAEVKILAHYSPFDDGEMVAVFCHKVCNETEVGRLVDQAIGLCFRPLRTEREKAIDEMMAIASTEWGSIEDVCGALYMAGYRKEVK